MGSDKRQRQKEARQARLEAERQAMRRHSRTRMVLWGFLIAAGVFGGLLLIATGGDDEEATDAETTNTTAAEEPPEPATDYGDTECPPADGVDEPTFSFDSAPRRCLEEGVDYGAVIETSMGEITVDLFEEKAPATVNSFVALSRYRFYEGSSFFRIIQEFVIQGGSPGDKPAGQGGPGYFVIDELPEPEEYQAGSLAMANRGAGTAGSQFFILTTDQGARELVAARSGRAEYTLFGEVTDGMDVVREIAAVQVVGDRAVDPIAIRSVTIVER